MADNCPVGWFNVVMIVPILSFLVKVSYLFLNELVVGASITQSGNRFQEEAVLLVKKMFLGSQFLTNCLYRAFLFLLVIPAGPWTEVVGANLIGWYQFILLKPLRDLKSCIRSPLILLSSRVVRPSSVLMMDFLLIVKLN